MKCVYGLVILLFSFSTVCSAQNRQLSIAGGFGFYHDVTVTAPSGEARAGFGPRFALGVAAGERFRDHFGGEFRYTFQDGDSELRSGSLEANLDAHSHSLLGDLLIYGRSRGPKLQPYGAVGVGVKIYQATEGPTPGRPLMNFATLINGTSARPLVSLGGGTQYVIGERWAVRIDLRDYATPFPNKLFALSPGAQVHGWLHDFVPLVGISRSF
jgi:outer membrane protein with beta-barrel domain